MAGRQIMQSFGSIWVRSDFRADDVSVVVTNQYKTENEDGGEVQSDGDL